MQSNSAPSSTYSSLNEHSSDSCFPKCTRKTYSLLCPKASYKRWLINYFTLVSEGISNVCGGITGLACLIFILILSFFNSYRYTICMIAFSYSSIFSEWESTFPLWKR